MRLQLLMSKQFSLQICCVVILQWHLKTTQQQFFIAAKASIISPRGLQRLVAPYMTMHWGGRSLNRQIEPSPGQQHDPTVRPSRVPGMHGQGWAFFNIYRSTLVVRCSELLLPQHGVDLTRAGPLNSLFYMNWCVGISNILQPPCNCDLCY